LQFGTDATVRGFKSLRHRSSRQVFGVEPDDPLSESEVGQLIAAHAEGAGVYAYRRERFGR
jgi:hypothetical protein